MRQWLRRLWLYYLLICEQEDEDMAWSNHKRIVEPPNGGYLQVELTPECLTTLEKLILGIGVYAMEKERLKTALICGRHMNEPLAYLGWGELKKEAERRHCSEAEALWDWRK